MRYRPRLAAYGLSLALACLAAPSSAQEDGDIERAKASFKAGANAYAAGDYLAAIQGLETAYALTPLPAIAFSLAQAERKQYGLRKDPEHLRRALTLYRRYLEQEPEGARKNDALLAIAELTPRLASGAAGEASPKQQVRSTRLMISSDTPGARISLDGGALSSSPLIREVLPGKHKAHVEARGYYGAEREVVALAGELILSELRLAERPSSLYVWAPAGAAIYVDGVYVGEGGPLVTVPLSLGAHQLTVAQKGRRVVRRDLLMKHGQSHSEYVTLEATTQRRLSEWLFMGGGLALSAGVVISAFAVRSENKAESFLGSLESTNRRTSQASVRGVPTSPDLAAYNASLAERTRFRTGAAVAVAGSLGLFITGLFLHELDQPSLTGSGARRSRSAARTATRDRKLDFSPVTATGDLGAALQLHF